MSLQWHHRDPCHNCAVCGGFGCFTWTGELPPEVHICAAGCDGLPPAIIGATA